MTEQEVQALRPCHLCENPREGKSYIDTINHPGKLLCASCACVWDVSPVALGMFRLLRTAIAAEDNSFLRNMAIIKFDVLLKTLETE